MERWQVIERYVLLALGAVLLGLAGWLAFFRDGPGRFAALALLLPCIFWVFWQALYEDKLGSEEPPSMGERAMHGLWLWARRIFLGGVAALFGFGGVIAFQSASRLQHYGVAALMGFLACMAAWVAIFGAGRHKSMTDDRSVHRERSRRYE